MPEDYPALWCCRWNNSLSSPSCRAEPAYSLGHLFCDSMELGTTFASCGMALCDGNGADRSKPHFWEAITIVMRFCYSPDSRG